MRVGRSETSHLICSINHITAVTGFYVEYNTGLKWVNRGNTRKVATSCISF